MKKLFTLLFQRIDPLVFSKQRADYFDYLYAVLSGSQGQLTVRELFYRDALRYGNSARGRLSAKWAKSCDVNGGDLYATWLGYFPLDELLLVRVSQNFGNQKLLDSFKSLAEHLELLIEARQILWSTLGAAISAILIVFGLCLLMPWWTIPALQHSFSGMPDAYLGEWSKSLFSFAELIKNWGILFVLLLGLAIFLFLYSLPRHTGQVRMQLDKFGIWRLYRQINALRFLSLCSILLQPSVGFSTQLKPVVSTFLESSNRWLTFHIQNILGNIDQGLTGAQAFDTGIMDQDLYWYFNDMTIANGLQLGMVAVHQRIQNKWLKQVKKQAQYIRWLCLLTAVFCVLAIGLWHYAAIDDLRRAWMMFHAS